MGSWFTGVEDAKGGETLVRMDVCGMEIAWRRWS